MSNAEINPQDASEIGEKADERLYMTADAELIEQIMSEIQNRDMTLSEFIEMAHEEYADGSITN